MAMSEKATHKKTRIISVVAATTIALACGTNVSCKCLRLEIVADVRQYAYSAWAPQFAEKLQLSATQSNIIVRLPFLLPVFEQHLTCSRALPPISACTLQAYPWA
jgi:hypothetical protein